LALCGKKRRADNVMVQGAVDAVLTYQELDQMFHHKNIDPENFPWENGTVPKEIWAGSILYPAVF
jgi:iron only hydrogenase large subunit-like protein